MPLWAPKGKDDDTPEKPKAAPRKVISGPDPFVLNAETGNILQSTAPEDAEEKEALLEHAARAVELRVYGYLTRPHDVTQLMAPFANVRALSIATTTLNDLPLLPCPEKLESLRLLATFQTIQNITRYTKLHTLQIANMSHSFTVQDPNQTERLSVLTQLHNLRTLDCCAMLTLEGRVPEARALSSRILGNNPEMENFTCAGNLDTDVVQALGNLPLRRLLLMHSAIDDDKFALLPFDTLEELRLHGNTLTNLEPLRDSALRVLHLRCQENLGDTQVICSIQSLEELDLSHCRLTDAQAEPLLQLSQRLRLLTLDSHAPRLSPKMCQRLKVAFGKKVSLELW